LVKIRGETKKLFINFDTNLKEQEKCVLFSVCFISIFSWCKCIATSMVFVMLYLGLAQKCWNF